MAFKREIKEGQQPQGIAERIVYRVTSTPWMVAPTSATAKIYNFTPSTGTYTDKTSTCMTGSVSVAGDEVTLPVIHSLTEGELYLVEVTMVKGSNTEVVKAWIRAER